MSSKAAEGVTNMPKLKPCPFCGGRAIMIEKAIYLDTGWYVACILCKIKTPLVLIDHPIFSHAGVLDESTRYTRKQAAKIVAAMWNRRMKK